MMHHQGQLVISCHADTGFGSHRVRRTEDGAFHGCLDNVVGVYSVMNAYFSGRMDFGDTVRVELTYGEEADMEGVREVLRTLSSKDVVVVVDVTGTRTRGDFTIEKCASSEMRSFVKSALGELSYELFEGCPDPIADEDECDIYAEKLPNVFFLGIPCYGGDYNDEMVFCRGGSISAVTEALIRLATAFNNLNDRSA